MGEPRGGVSLIDGNKVASLVSDVNLARSEDLDGAGTHHFSPVGDPANRPRDGEDHVEHVLGNMEGSHQQARVEINVRIETSAHEVIIGESLPLDFEGNLEQGVVLHSNALIKINKEILKNRSPWVIRLKDAMAEAPETLSLVVLALIDELRDVVDGLDLSEHFQTLFSSASVLRPPERGDTSRNGGEGIGQRRAGHTNSGS
mmetsp:Transcript_33069/g.50731  ORF Transcript_33069/g.50731 Transcript_33069/m.50731 type:complete len:202 (-) Transcript_33069:1002-1607(-)